MIRGGLAVSDRPNVPVKLFAAVGRSAMSRLETGTARD